VRGYRDLARFFGSLFFSMAGLSVAISFAFIYGDQVIRWSPGAQVGMFVLTNVAASVGAIAFGKLQSRWGNLRTYRLTLLVWVVAVLAIASTTSIARLLAGVAPGITATNVYLVVGALAGLCLGATQSSGRTIVAVFAPSSKSGEFFGFWGSSASSPRSSGCSRSACCSRRSGSRRRSWCARRSSRPRTRSAWASTKPRHRSGASPRRSLRRPARSLGDRRVRLCSHRAADRPRQPVSHSRSTKMATFQDLKDKIEALSDDDFEVGIAEKSPPTEAQLAELEERIGRPFEPELRAFLLGWGLLIVEVKETAWPRPKGIEALQAWRKQYGFTVLGAGGDLPPELQIEAALTPALLERPRRPADPPLRCEVPDGDHRRGHGRRDPGRRRSRAARARCDRVHARRDRRARRGHRQDARRRSKRARARRPSASSPAGAVPGPR
jgi:hypothetical protein